MLNSKLPEWLEKRYSMLLEEFREKEFSREDAAKVLKEKIKEEEQSVLTILSELRKAGWLEVRFDPKDARKKIYRLKGKDEIISKSLELNKNQLARGDIESILKKAADLIRTRVDYKFILILLFLKRISDKWELEYEEAYKEALEDGLSEKEAREEAKSSAYHEFDLPEEFHWENIRKDVNKLPEKLSQTLKIIAERNAELRGVIDSIDFIQFTSNRENAEILRQLIELFSAKKLHQVSPDILGDSYEWVLRYFAPQKAKEGEVYTPREVINLLVEMVDPKPKEKVYDPACGSGGMLISSYKHVEEKYGKQEAKRIFLYGQEYNPQTYALCKMNIYIHDIRDIDIASGNTLIYPKFKEGDKLKQFDIVLANPPWNQDGFGEDVLKKGELWRQRYKYGFTPNQSADWTWAQHMLASAKDDTGRVGIVIDNGCLFRGGKEKAIRERIFKGDQNLAGDLVDCVILLPEKLFYNTGAPGAIIIFNKNKPVERREKVFFINASSEYEQHPEIRKLNRLGKEHIEKVSDAYRKYKNIEGFSRVVSLDEIKENDFNLNVTLYVFLEEEKEDVDINKEWQELHKIEEDIKKIEEKIEGYLREVG